MLLTEILSLVWRVGRYYKYISSIFQAGLQLKTPIEVFETEY
jgi:hypothetical protein